MAYSYPEIRSFKGLYLQQNSFNVPDGAMELASNVIIKSDEVITKTAGLYEYWRPDGISSLDLLRATYTYQGRIIGFFATGIGYFTDTTPFADTNNKVGTLTALTGLSVSFSNSVNILEQGGNLYFTAEEGIYKIESFTDTVKRAGIPPGLGIMEDLDRVYTHSGILYADTQTGYVGVFGRRDFNGNLRLGTPSDVVTVGVPAPVVGAAYTIVAGVLTITLASANERMTNVILSDATNSALNGDQEVFSITDGVSISIVTAEADSVGTCTVSLSLEPFFIVQIPSEILVLADEYFVQLYRTSSSLGVTVPPSPDFRLVSERTLSQTNITEGFIAISDFVDSEFLGAELYTNPNTREGPLQENSRPPKALFMASYKGYTAYANIVSVQRMLLNLVNPQDLIGNILSFKSGATTESYKGVNSTVYLPGSVNLEDVTVIGNNPLIIEWSANHGFPVGSLVKILDAGTILTGEYAISAVSAANRMTFSTATGICVSAKAQVMSDGTNRLYNGYDATGVTITNVAEWTEFVARDLCRAINANTSGFMYANYTSTFEQFPGKMSLQSKHFIDPIFVKYQSTPPSPLFIQNIPTSFSSGIQYYSESDQLPHVVYFAKYNENEAVPTTNFMPIGDKSAGIIGIYALKDSLIVLKTDGARKIVGDIMSQFVVADIDLTVEFIAGMKRPADTINNSVMSFCNQGVAQITEQSVQVVSRRIEDVIQPLIGRDLSNTFLTGHESERLFYVQTEGLNAGDARVTWIYNVLNQTWTSTPHAYDHLELGPGNALLGIKTDTTLAKPTLWRQRNTKTRIDWCGEYASGTIAIEPTAKLTGVWTRVAGNLITPEIGDIIFSGVTFNRIIAVSGSGPYTLTFAQVTPITTVGTPTVTLYKAYESIVKMAPFHAGQVGRNKHFALMQIHMRQAVITNLKVNFSTATFLTTSDVQWSAREVSSVGSIGWGMGPWGLFPWGNPGGLSIKAGTEPSSILRIKVPRFAARTTFIQPVITHKQCGQPMYIQSLSFAVHGYGERVST